MPTTISINAKDLREAKKLKKWNWEHIGEYERKHGRKPRGNRD